MRRTSERPATFLHRTASGTAIFDVGQNISGWVRLELDGDAGATYTLRHAEALQENGELYVENLRSARATDIYIRIRSRSASL